MASGRAPTSATKRAEVNAGKNSWYWSLTGPALNRLLSGPFAPTHIEVTTYGNLFAATAFLHGAAVEGVSSGKLDKLDDAYPVIVAARVTA
jgi:hypothetical protein